MFKDLKPAELKTAAEYFGVDLEGTPTKVEIIAALEADGVTWAQYNEIFNPTVKEEPTVITVSQRKNVTRENGVLLKMERENPTFEVKGYRFTKKHPFIAVDPDDADYIVHNYEGFRPALPSEVEKYYS